MGQDHPSSTKGAIVILADHQLRAALAAGTLAVDPLGPSAVQPASIDLRLGGDIKRLGPSVARLDARSNQDAAWLDCGHTWDAPIDLHPREFILAATVEHVVVGRGLRVKLEGKSSLARMGLVVHLTAGYVETGWRGRLTLELVNLAPVPIRLYAGMYIAQIEVSEAGAAEQPYAERGHYVDADGPQASRAWLQSAER